MSENSYVAIGAVLGTVVGILVPYLMAMRYVLSGGDETAAGVYSFFTCMTVPIGFFAGAFAGAALHKRRRK